MNFAVNPELLVNLATLERYFDRLWPICRSITGSGFRSSLNILREVIPLEVHEVPSGEKVLDWVVPQEWNIDDAYILDPDGRKIVDFQENNLHVLGYSIPVDQKIELKELEEHLYSLPDMPTAIPYLTSYYKERWGFCLTHAQRQALKPGTYHVKIQSRLAPGSLTYGDLVLSSTTGEKDEILVSTYLCHPSMANNELSGPLVTTFLYDYLRQLPYRKYNYRFVFIPETIGSITYLSRWGEHLKKHCLAGFLVNSCGDPMRINYKRSRRGNSIGDICAENAVHFHAKEKSKEYKVLDFFPTGSDERQYCSPGFNLPVGVLMRSLVSEYPEYHTSLDNKDFISFEALRETIEMHLKTFFSIEQEGRLQNLSPYGEPNLGRRGLYPTLGSTKQQDDEVRKIIYLLAYSDGDATLSEISKKANCSILNLARTAETLIQHKLMKRL